MGTPRKSWFYAFATNGMAQHSTGYRCAVEVKDEAGNLYSRAHSVLSRVCYGDHVFLGRLLPDHHGKPQRWRMAPIKADLADWAKESGNLSGVRTYFEGERRLFVLVKRAKPCKP